MKKYRINSIMTGILYFLGTVFGVLGGIVGGEVLSSMISDTPLSDTSLLNLVAENSSQLTMGALCVVMMGISLVAMTVFLYPIIRKDSKELALGMLLFRGALEGVWYFATTLGILALVILGKEYIAAGSDVASLEVVGNTLYELQGYIGAIGTIFFTIGATCIYISFYRTKLIPRWITIWGLVAILPYLVRTALIYFDIESSIGIYLEMPFALQEIVMAFWLVIKGFNPEAIKALDGVKEVEE